VRSKDKVTSATVSERSGNTGPERTGTHVSMPRQSFKVHNNGLAPNSGHPMPSRPHLCSVGGYRARKAPAPSAAAISAADAGRISEIGVLLSANIPLRSLLRDTMQGAVGRRRRRPSIGGARTAAHDGDVVAAVLVAALARRAAPRVGGSAVVLRGGGGRRGGGGGGGGGGGRAALRHGRLDEGIVPGLRLAASSRPRPRALPAAAAATPVCSWERDRQIVNREAEDQLSTMIESPS